MARKTGLADAFAQTRATGGPEPAPEATDDPNTPPSRRGRRAVTIYVDPAAHRQLRLISLDSGQSAQALLTGALNDLFERHGKPRIA